MVEAIRKVYHGQPSLTPAVARKLLVAPQELSDPSRDPVPTPTPVAEPPGELLTEREVEVLRLMARGLSNVDIARQMVVGEGTVRFMFPTYSASSTSKTAPRPSCMPCAPAWPGSSNHHVSAGSELTIFTFLNFL